MIMITIAALMTAVTVGILIHPLMKQGRGREACVIAGLTALCALGFYLWRGSPDMPGRPALFDTTSPQAEERALTGQELTLMQALAEKPDDTALMLALGAVRIRAGRPLDAIAILERAREKKPKDRDILLELGAAHFAAGLLLLMENNDRTAAKSHWQDALATAPADAPYRAQIKDALSQLE